MVLQMARHVPWHQRCRSGWKRRPQASSPPSGGASTGSSRQGAQIGERGVAVHLLKGPNPVTICSMYLHDSKCNQRFNWPKTQRRGSGASPPALATLDSCSAPLVLISGLIAPSARTTTLLLPGLTAWKLWQSRSGRAMALCMVLGRSARLLQQKGLCRGKPRKMLMTERKLAQNVSHPMNRRMTYR